MSLNRVSEEETLLRSGKMIVDDGKEFTTPHLLVDRIALTVEGRHKQCLYEVPEPLGVAERLKYSLGKACTCSRERLKKFIYGKLPILSWLIGYDVKNWLLGDLVAGTTVAIMQIPQGMGFALLANIPAICGIYMAFFQSLIYAFLGTSRHNSMGAFAVITLMAGKVVKELATFPVEAPVGAGLESNSTEGFIINAENISDSMMFDSPEGGGTYTPIQIATVVCFMVGVWHMILGILQLGSLAVFLSDMLVSGLTTAAAVHVFTSQVKDLLGISVKGSSGPLKIIYSYIEIAKAVPSVNVTTLIITITTVSVLLLNNEILKPIVAKYSRVPIPIELIAVVTGTAVSYLVNLTQTYDVHIVGDIPTGFPPAALPPLELLGRVAVDSLVIAIVSYTINFSLAKIFAAKHDHPVDSTQELYASGIGNLVSSFFACAPTGSALARVVIQDAVGGKTQLASLVVCFLLALVLLFIGPVFETLPKAVLASIIIVALKGMFMQVKDMMAMWKVSRIEAIIWLVTFFSVVIIEIDIGLLIGVVFSLFVLLAKNQKPTTFKLGRVPNTDIYLDMNTYPQAKEIPGMRLFKIVGPIHFANRENLKRFIIKGTNLDPKVLQKALKKKTEDETQKEKIIMQAIETGNYTLYHLEHMVRILLLDLSGVSYIDSAGGKFLEQMRKEYEKVNIWLCIAGLPENVYELMSKSGSLKGFPPEHLFHSTHDAIVILTQ